MPIADMDVIFITKLILSVIIGGAWVITVMHVADRLGPKIGGMLAGLPSTLLFGLFFIAWTQGVEYAIAATTVVPLMGGISGVFLLLYVILIRYGLKLALGVAVMAWCLIVFCILQLKLPAYPILIAIYFTLTILCYLIMEFVLKVKSGSPRKVSYGYEVILLRGLLSGSLIGLAVVLSKISGPVLGGVFALFPAMFISTLVTSYLGHGAHFSAGLAKSALISSISIVAFSIAVRYTYSPLGFVLGTLVSVGFAIVVGSILYRFIIIRIR